MFLAAFATINGAKFPANSVPLRPVGDIKSKFLTSTINYCRIKKSQIIISCIILTYLPGCKKDKIDNTPFISVTIDGINHSFTKDVNAAKNSGLSSKLFVLGSDNQNTIGFGLSDTTTGDYSELNSPSQAKTLINFQLITLQGLHLNVLDNTDPCKLTITNINSSFVEGYFNGTIVGQSRKKLTNGKFKVYFR